MICVRFTFADWHVCFRCQCNFADVYHANKVLLHVFRPWVKFFSSTTILLIAFWCDTHRIPKAFFTPPINFSFSDSRSCNREGSVHLCQGRTLLFLNFHGPLPLSSGGKCGCEAGLEHEWWSQRLCDANLLCLQVHMKAHRLTWPESCRTTYKPELQMNLVEQFWPELRISPNQKQSWRQPPTTSWGWLVKMQIPRTMPRP